MYDSRFGRWLSPDPYKEFYSSYVGMGNRPHMTTDPTGGFTGGTTILNEVVITASRLPSVASIVGSIAGSVGTSLLSNAFSSSFNSGALDCPKCPKTPQYDQYRNSNLHYGYSEAVGGDGAFLRLRGVTVYPKRVDVEAFAKLGLRAVMMTLNAAMLGASLDAIAMDGMATAGTYSVARANAVAASKLDGSFSVSNWSGYPVGGVKPTGPFRLLEGAEYTGARAAANQANATLRAANPTALKGLQIHEIHPIKFGGSPTALSNKVFLTPAQHAQYTNFWNSLMRGIK
jgi:hypothetical protein